MGWKNWLIVLLIGLTAGWMLFDGTRALIVGDYVTPTSGEYVGRLGPWANILQAVGMEPRSTFVKAAFVVYGVTSLIAVTGFATDKPWGKSALSLMAVLGLWYLPIGTATNMIAIALLFLFQGDPAHRSII